MDEFRLPREPLVAAGQIETFTRDMTATFAADVPLGEAQKKLAEVNQWLPIDGEPSAAVGSLVEWNSSGPLRLGYGAWRDLLLGCQFKNPAGELISAGGRVVKNVAGYDLTKFMIGQRGLFGRILTITTRTYRRPAEALLAQFRPDARIVSQLLTTPLRPHWAILVRDALYCGYLGSAAEMEYWQANLAAGAGPSDAKRRTVDQDIAHRAELFRWPTDDPANFRASVPPARLNDLAASTPSPWAADAAFGIIVGCASDEPARRSVIDLVRQAQGSVTFNDESGLMQEENPALQQLLARLRQAFGGPLEADQAMVSGGAK